MPLFLMTPHAPSKAKRFQVAGTSLIEVLVVMVVFLIGILAVIQIFPGGFKVLASTRNLSEANALARGEVERLKGLGSELPDMILPVTTSGDTIDATHFADDLGLYDSANATINPDGTVTDNGTTYSNYAYYSGGNVFRRVIGEGSTIPAPQAVGTYFGGVLVLHFGPTRQLSSTEQTAISVYGNDYDVQIASVPSVITYGQAYLDDPNSLTPTLSVQVDDATTFPTFRLSMSIYTKDTSNVLHQRDIIAAQIGGNTATYAGNYLQVGLATLAPTNETFQSVIPDSIKVERNFVSIPPTTAFSSKDPYQYKVLNTQMGVLLFNPVGYNYEILRGTGQREPLRARTDYEVQDWRIISDEFRLKADESIYRLSLPSLKVMGNSSEDGKVFAGLGVSNADGTQSDVIFQDLQTGGILLYNPANPRDPSPPTNEQNDIQVDPTKSSFFVDKSAGTFKIVDVNRGASGTVPQVELFLPDPTTTTGFASSGTPVNVDGRLVRALYMAKGEWSVQPQIAASVYHESPTAPGAGQYLVGTGTRIYFPNMDLGNKVNIDQLNYIDSTNQIHSVEGVSAVVRNKPSDANGAYIDITDIASTATALDFSKGFAVRGIRGVSVGVRVLNNPTVWIVGADSPSNFDALNKFGQGWRKASVETFVQRGGF